MLVLLEEGDSKNFQTSLNLKGTDLMIYIQFQASGICVQFGVSPIDVAMFCV